MRTFARILGAFLIWVGVFLPISWIVGITSVIDTVPPDIRWQPYTVYACIGLGLHFVGSLLAMNTWRKRLLTFVVFSGSTVLLAFLNLQVPWGAVVNGFSIVVIIPWIAIVNGITKTIHLPENREPNPVF